MILIQNTVFNYNVRSLVQSISHWEINKHTYTDSGRTVTQ